MPEKTLVAGGTATLDDEASSREPAGSEKIGTGGASV
jgi:hypothetical protein